MNHKHKIALFALALLASGFAASESRAQVSYLGLIEWKPGEVHIVDGSTPTGGVKLAELEFEFNWEGRDVASQHSSTIVPVIVSADSTQSFNFAPIYIDGRIRAKAVERAAVLNGYERPADAYVLTVGRDESQTVQYKSSIPYDPAMLDGHLVIHEIVTGCAGCKEGEDSLRFDDVLKRYIPDWVFTRGSSGGDKGREIHERAEVKFIINLHDIRPDFADNATVLENVIASVSESVENELFVVHSVSFSGYASPDGPESFNTGLAERRSRSLANYVLERVPALSNEIITINSGAEDWTGLFEAVAADPQIADNPTMAEVREMLRDDNRDATERVLKRDRELFEYLKPGILPSLRRTEYTISYSIRSFTPEEAEKIWREHPDWLSIDEFNSVASLYGPEHPDYCEVLTTAAEVYPSDARVVNVAAIALYEAGRTDEALKMIDGRDEAVLLNTLGIINAEQGKYEQARKAFTEAEAGGDENAAHNLEQLEAVLYQL